MILPFLAHIPAPDASSVVSEGAAELGDAAAFPSPASARAMLDRLLATGRLVPRSRPELFVVEMVGDGSAVAGVLAVVSADHEVRPHERVLSDRVSSLARHLDALGAQAVPVTLAHRRHQAIADASLPSSSGTPLLERASGSRPRGSGLSIRMPGWSTSSLAPSTSSTATTGLPRQLSAGPGFSP